MALGVGRARRGDLGLTESVPPEGWALPVRFWGGVLARGVGRARRGDLGLTESVPPEGWALPVCFWGAVLWVGCWRWGLGARRGGDWGLTESVPPGLPAQFVDLALVGPVVGVDAVAVAHGIMADIIPFLTVTFAASQLTVPEMALPERYGCSDRGMPLAADRAFPIPDPRCQWRFVFRSRGTKEMEVVGQYDIAPDIPSRGIGPNLTQECVHDFGG